MSVRGRDVIKHRHSEKTRERGSDDSFWDGYALTSNSSKTEITRP